MSKQRKQYVTLNYMLAIDTHNNLFTKQISRDKGLNIFNSTKRDQAYEYLKYAASFYDSSNKTKFIGFESWISGYLPTDLINKDCFIFDTPQAKQAASDFQEAVDFCKETIIWRMLE